MWEVRTVGLVELDASFAGAVAVGVVGGGFFGGAEFFEDRGAESVVC